MLNSCLFGVRIRSEAYEGSFWPYEQAVRSKCRQTESPCKAIDEIAAIVEAAQAGV
jgi:hypothetical protein